MNEETDTPTRFPPGDVCPICGIADNEEIEVIPIAGTGLGNNVCRGAVVHARCLMTNLMMYRPGAEPIMGRRAVIGVWFEERTKQ